MQKKSTRFVFILIIGIIFPIFSYANLVINEVAWMGGKDSANDEWIELFNNSNKKILLNSYSLFIGEKEIKLKGYINANDFYLLERTNEDTLPSLKADLIYSGAIKKTGQQLTLVKNNQIIDKADFLNGFKYGNLETKQTMERIEDNWQTSIMPFGSPKSKNIKKEEKQVISSFELKNKQTFPYSFPIFLGIVFGGMVIIMKKWLKNIN